MKSLAKEKGAKEVLYVRDTAKELVCITKLQNW